MPPTETEQGMLCLTRHDNCPWDEALKAADVSWTGLQYACLKVLHLYCKAFEQEDIIDLVIRKTCKSCGCDRLQHSVYHEELGSVRDRLGLRETRAQVGYDGPPGLTAKQTELYWSSLAEREPNVGGATGAAAWREWRTRALASQLPKQDLSLSHTRHIDEAHRKQFEDFVAARNEIALDIGVAGQHHGAAIECLGCDKPIRNGSITILAPRLYEEAFFHPACFSCSECDELLVELSYCALDGRLYCVRHYDERLKPRCHACDELFKSCPGVISLHPSCSRHLTSKEPAPTCPNLIYSECVNMGLVLSAIITYAGAREALECLRHILAGMLPDGDPDFQDLVDYYTGLLQKSANPGNSLDWTTQCGQSLDWTTQCGQGYLCLSQDDNGKLKQAAVKYYDGQPNSTAILFSTKISSFGQESVESNPPANGDYRTDRYTPTRTKTIITNASESFSVGNRNRSHTSCENVSDPNLISENSFDRDERDAREISEAKEKLTWHYRPKSPTPQNLPEIHFQSIEEDKIGDEVYSEDFLRSLDGIKFRPLQRSDPSGRRRSFKKRHSSSSTSSRDSRASREEELKMFTSLEEAELERAHSLGSAPNLAARSYSRSRSREHSNERRNDPSTESPEGLAEDEADRPKLKDLPKLGSFEEEEKEKEVTEEEDEIEDFWGNSGD